jgi:hypothetical protein
MISSRMSRRSRTAMVFVGAALLANGVIVATALKPGSGTAPSSVPSVILEPRVSGSTSRSAAEPATTPGSVTTEHDVRGVAVESVTVVAAENDVIDLTDGAGVGSARLPPVASSEPPAPPTTSLKLAPNNVTPAPTPSPQASTPDRTEPEHLSTGSGGDPSGPTPGAAGSTSSPTEP